MNNVRYPPEALGKKLNLLRKAIGKLKENISEEEWYRYVGIAITEADVQNYDEIYLANAKKFLKREERIQCYTLSLDHPPYYIVFRDKDSGESIPLKTNQPLGCLQIVDLIQRFIYSAGEYGISRIDFNRFPSDCLFYRGNEVSLPKSLTFRLSSTRVLSRFNVLERNEQYFSCDFGNRRLLFYQGRICLNKGQDISLKRIFSKIITVSVGDPLSGAVSTHQMISEGILLPQRLQTFLQAFRIVMSKSLMINPPISSTIFSENPPSLQNEISKKFYDNIQRIVKNISRRIFYYHPVNAKLSNFCEEYRYFVSLLIHVTEKMESSFLYGLSSDVLIYNIIPHFTEYEIFTLCFPILREYSKFLNVKRMKSQEGLFINKRPLIFYYDRNMKILRRKEDLLYISMYFRTIIDSMEKPRIELLDSLVTIRIDELLSFSDPFIEYLESYRKKGEKEDEKESKMSPSRFCLVYARKIMKNIAMCVHEIINEMYSEKLIRLSAMSSRNDQFDIGLKPETLENLYLFLTDFCRLRITAFRNNRNIVKKISFLLQFIQDKKKLMMLSNPFSNFVSGLVLDHKIQKTEENEEIKRLKAPDLTEVLRRLFDMIDVHWDHGDFENAFKIFSTNVFDILSHLCRNRLISGVKARTKGHEKAQLDLEQHRVDLRNVGIVDYGDLIDRESDSLPMEITRKVFEYVWKFKNHELYFFDQSYFSSLVEGTTTMFVEYMTLDYPGTYDLKFPLRIHPIKELYDTAFFYKEMGLSEEIYRYEVNRNIYGIFMLPMLRNIVCFDVMIKDLEETIEKLLDRINESMKSKNFDPFHLSILTFFFMKITRFFSVLIDTTISRDEETKNTSETRFEEMMQQKRGLERLEVLNCSMKANDFPTLIDLIGDYLYSLTCFIDYCEVVKSKKKRKKKQKKLDIKIKKVEDEEEEEEVIIEEEEEKDFRIDDEKSRSLIDILFPEIVKIINVYLHPIFLEQEERFVERSSTFVQKPSRRYGSVVMKLLIQLLDERERKNKKSFVNFEIDKSSIFSRMDERSNLLMKVIINFLVSYFDTDVDMNIFPELSLSMLFEKVNKNYEEEYSRSLIRLVLNDSESNISTESDKERLLNLLVIRHSIMIHVCKKYEQAVDEIRKSTKTIIEDCKLRLNRSIIASEGNIQSSTYLDMKVVNSSSTTNEEEEEPKKSLTVRNLRFSNDTISRILGLKLDLFVSINHKKARIRIWDHENEDDLQRMLDTLALPQTSQVTLPLPQRSVRLLDDKNFMNFHRKIEEESRKKLGIDLSVKSQVEEEEEKNGGDFSKHEFVNRYSRKIPIFFTEDFKTQVLIDSGLDFLHFSGFPFSIEEFYIDLMSPKKYIDETNYLMTSTDLENRGILYEDEVKKKDVIRYVNFVNDLMIRFLDLLKNRYRPNLCINHFWDILSNITSFESEKLEVPIDPNLSEVFVDSNFHVGMTSISKLVLRRKLGFDINEVITDHSLLDKVPDKIQYGGIEYDLSRITDGPENVIYAVRKNKLMKIIWEKVETWIFPKLVDTLYLLYVDGEPELFHFHKDYSNRKLEPAFFIKLLSACQHTLWRDFERM